MIFFFLLLSLRLLSRLSLLLSDLNIDLLWGGATASFLAIFFGGFSLEAVNLLLGLGNVLFTKGIYVSDLL
jgi:hypothetical protein